MLDMKQWYQSKTVWGALIAMAAPLLRHAGVEMGLAEQANLADALASFAGAFGGVLAIYGRVMARGPIDLGGGRN
ncbi:MULTISPECIES: hypothetical protein [Alphaproteobacteria]|uniref:Holin n=2 Tax=Alphaproteobacteria TaxID=28211 RepID=A0A512HG09_9HYPH|nr:MULTISPECIES: hypothetical protein [Alphaproteobacteria]GEO84389.1 hypothetical protein RNA01_13210 [Ciceribacter naphthalenivorans]GLR22352.1 hypothetical protein GCM10007920_21390 [Ciceribacter naphthalenivorans]GLT05208.1 hypothetical protein GCM10007926_21390 [Sphingomonas psychrolutea]